MIENINLLIDPSVEENDLKLIQQLINEYTLSVNHYNEHPEFANSVWQMNSKSSFIHPRGHERGWKQINDAFYGQTMSERFYDRQLEIVGHPEIELYGHTAIVVFYWVFHAKFKSNHEPIETKGRETQVFVKNNEQWKLVHVHYSNMPVTGDREGF